MKDPHHGSPAWAWCNGRLVAFSHATVPLEDRGLQFGESLYDVMAVAGGEPFRLANHVDRMARGARELGLDGAVPDVTAWRDIVAQLHRHEPHRSALLYSQVTGGSAPRRHLPDPRPQPFFAAYLRPFAFPTPTELSQGIAVITLPDLRWARCDLKTTMLLPAVLAKRAAAERGAIEAIFLGQDGFVREGASSSVFLVMARSVSSPPHGSHILPSVSSLVVRETCDELGVHFEERPLTLSDLQRADEVFIASTTTLLMPVVHVDRSPVGGGTPGPVALQLAYHFQRKFWGAVDP